MVDSESVSARRPGPRRPDGAPVGADEALLIYRRTIDQMPADPEEIHACQEEGVEIVELAAPHALHVENGKLAGLICTKTEYRGDRDSSGRNAAGSMGNSRCGREDIVCGVGAGGCGRSRRHAGRAADQFE